MIDFLTAPLSLLHVVLALAVVFLISSALGRWLRRLARSVSRDQFDFLSFVRSEVHFTDHFIRIVEDLIRSQPERSEMLEIAKLDLVVRKSRLEECVKILDVGAPPLVESSRLKRLLRRMKREDGAR